MIMSSSFKPAWWLSNPHAQTMYASLTRRGSPPIDSWERVELPDGDFIDLAWVTKGLDASAPLVIFLHGLGGCVNSSYVAGQFKAYQRQGWRGLFMHFRGASPEPNRQLRAYHSGDTADLDYLLNYLHLREPTTSKAVVGFSMGGNVLLKWLGEQGSQALIDVAVAVSVPFQLFEVTQRVSSGFSRVYQSYLLRRMRRMLADKLDYYPQMRPKNWPNLNKLTSLISFDDTITAPIHGYDSAKAYYQAASSRQFIPSITTPTLIIHALDDPFMTPDVIPLASEIPFSVTLELSNQGGHVGFISGNTPGRAHYWLDSRIPEFLSEFI